MFPTSRMLRRSARAALIAAAVLGTVAATAKPQPRFADPLDTRADALHGALRADEQTIIAIASAGARRVAVGLRGLIVLSDDDGVSWRQADQVPVQSDLTALHFIDAQRGWAVGHEGVILHTRDGGETWVKQFDGRMAATMLPPHYQQKVDAGDTAFQPLLEELKLNTGNGPTLPFLGVHFESAEVGYAVGSFGMIIATEDGGKTWMPWLEHIDNPNYLNLNEIRAIGGTLYIAGERGTVYRLDRARRHFVAVPTTYRGSFFGLIGNEAYVLAYGLAGNIYRSGDAGQIWTRIDTGLPATLTGATYGADGRTLVLSSAAGRLLISRDDGHSFTVQTVKQPTLLTAVAPLAGTQFIVGSLRGLQRHSLQSRASGAPRSID